MNIPDILHEDYWVVEPYFIHKIKVVEHNIFDDMRVIKLSFLKYIDGDILSPEVSTHTVSVGIFPIMYYKTKDEALIQLSHMLLKTKVDHDGNTNVNSDDNCRIEIGIANNIIDYTKEKYPEKFI
jgi:hypothetical protein